jgi:hypothetical protein
VVIIATTRRASDGEAIALSQKIPAALAKRAVQHHFRDLAHLLPHLANFPHPLIKPA